MPTDKAAALRAVMDEAFPDANVGGWEDIEPDMPNYPTDRHVAAAAVQDGRSAPLALSTKRRGIARIL